MDPVTLVVIPGFIGGVCFALILARWNRRRTDRIGPTDGPPVSTDFINMAHIRVAGVGGLGFVAIAVAVAFALPTIGRALATALVLGALLGVVMILVRRSAGPMRSSGKQPGANTTLSIDSIEPPGARKEEVTASSVRR